MASDCSVASLNALAIVGSVMFSTGLSVDPGTSMPTLANAGPEKAARATMGTRYVRFIIDPPCGTPAASAYQKDNRARIGAQPQDAAGHIRRSDLEALCQEGQALGGTGIQEHV